MVEDEQQQRRLEAELQQQKREWAAAPMWVFWFLVVVGLSVFTRFVRLEFPAQTVYDEVHFGGFAMLYVKGEYHFDVNPPLGKLIHYWVGTRFCEAPAQLDYDLSVFNNIGTPFPHDCYVFLRRASALAGAILPPFAFLTVKAMGRSLSGAILASGLVLLENSIVTQSRLIILDAFLWVFIALAAWGFVNLLRAGGEQSGVVPVLLQQVWWGAVTGLGVGGAVSVKWPGVSVVLAFAVAYYWENFVALRAGSDDEEGEEVEQKKTAKGNKGKKVATKKTKGNSKHSASRWGSVLPLGIASAVLLAVAFGVYYQSWVWHFELLPKSGLGNEWHARRFLASLEGSGHELLPGESPYSVQEKVLEVNKKLLDAWQQTQSPHDWASTWWQWPFNIKPIFYWVSVEGEGEAEVRREIWVSGNPVVFAVSGVVLPAFLMFALSLVHSDRRRSPREIHYGVSGGWLLLGWLANCLFYAFTRRVTFFYQHVPGHYCLMLLSAVVLDKFVTHPTLRRLFVAIVLLLAAAGFYYGQEWTYGFTFDEKL